MKFKNLDEFINGAKPGDSFVYYKGETPRERLGARDRGYSDCPFRIAAKMAESGLFTLFQRRVGERFQAWMDEPSHPKQNARVKTYEYLIVRINPTTERKLDCLSQECTLKALEDIILRPDLGR